MNDTGRFHLNEDHLFRAVIAETELSAELRAHLATCPQCRGSKERFEKNLSQLGQMAKELSPIPQNKIVLPVEKNLGFSKPFINWKLMTSMAAAAAMAFLLLLWSPRLNLTHSPTLPLTARATWEADPVMIEIDALSINALPSIYMDISGESYLGLEDEFIEFVVPSTENESLPLESGVKGALLC